MRNPHQLIVTASILSILLLSCPAGAAQTVQLDADSDGKVLSVAVGATLRISLPGNATTGYQWLITDLQGRAVQPTGPVDYVPAKKAQGRLGAGGTFISTLRAVAPGQSQLTLSYLRPWEKDKPAEKTYTLGVKVEKEGTNDGLTEVLSHVDNSAELKKSLPGTGLAVKFTRPAELGEVIDVELYASRYGLPKPPTLNFEVYLLDAKQKLLKTFTFPYSLIDRGKMKWYTLKLSATAVPETFYIGMNFHADVTKGIFIGMDYDSRRTHSFNGLPQKGYTPVGDRFDWMIRATVRKAGGVEPSGTPRPATPAPAAPRASDITPTPAETPDADVDSDKPAQLGLPEKKTDDAIAHPRVTATIPAAMDTAVDPMQKQITVTFDQPMLKGSYSWTGGGDTFPEVTGEPTYNADATTCTLPVTLRAGKVYWIGINSPTHQNFKTPEGEPASRYVILFATRTQSGQPTPLPDKLANQARAINAAP
jgi:inhibitor of cysteine peptidase